MNNSIKILAVMIFLATSAFSRADDQSSGCGLGWMLFKKNSLVSSSLRATTNALAVNSSAMTTGTSGCAKHDVVMKEKEALYFAEANYQKLLNEMAEGKGEHLKAFAKVLGCNPSAAASAGKVFQSKYPEIFTTDSVKPEQLLQNVSNAIYGTEMAAGCGYAT